MRRFRSTNNWCPGHTRLSIIRRAVGGDGLGEIAGDFVVARRSCDRGGRIGLIASVTGRAIRTGAMQCCRYCHRVVGSSSPSMELPESLSEVVVEVVAVCVNEPRASVPESEVVSLSLPLSDALKSPVMLLPEEVMVSLPLSENDSSA